MRILNCFIRLSVCIFLVLFLNGANGGLLFAELIPECQDIAYVEENSSRIIKGTVKNIDTQEDANGHVATLVTVEVQSDIKGDGANPVVIKIFGGTVKKDGQFITTGSADDPSFVVKQPGRLYLDQPKSPFYEGQYYSTVCSTGVMPD